LKTFASGTPKFAAFAAQVSIEVSTMSGDSPTSDQMSTRDQLTDRRGTLDRKRIWER
jgi:hypothetical protein